MARRSLVVVAVAALVLLSAPASADEAQDRAARSFDAAQRAFAAGAYRRAALMFEEAYAASRHPSTLFNAAKARARAGDVARAATLYAKIEAESPSPRDREDARFAREALQPKIGRVQVTGEFEEASVDGVAVSAAGPSYVEPGSHVVTGQLQGRTLRKVVEVAAGASVEVKLASSDAVSPSGVAAPVGPAASVTAPASAPAASPAVRPEAPHHGLPRVLTFVLGGATIVVGTFATISAIDTLSQRDRFDRTGADADLDDGLAKQTRTNVLLGVTAGLAVVTGVVALLTDWPQARAAGRASVGTF